jgi:hypothetical protein
MILTKSCLFVKPMKVINWESSAHDPRLQGFQTEFVAKDLPGFEQMLCFRGFI